MNLARLMVVPLVILLSVMMVMSPGSFMMLKGGMAGSIAFEGDSLINDDDTTSPQERSDTAVSGNDIYIVWQDRRLGNWDIYSRASHDGGLTFSPEVRVDDTLKTSTAADDRTVQEKPVACIDPDGNVHVVWQDDREGRSLIYYSVSTDKGASFSSNRPVAVYTFGRQTDPDMDISPDGDIVVVWEDDRAKPFYTQVYASASSDGGATFTSGVKVSDAPIIRECKEPAVTCPGNGIVEIVWSDNRTDDFDIYFSVSADLAADFDPPVRISHDPSQSDQDMPDIDSNATSIFVAWKDSRGPSSDIYLTASTQASMSFKKDLLAHPNQTSGHQYEPEICLDDAGDLNIVWSSSPGISDTKADIQMTKYLANGTLEKVYTVNEALKDTTQEQPSISVSPYGRGHITWTDNRRGHADIYYTRTTESGQEGMAPVLGSVRVDPEIGGLGTKFTFYATYFDLENDPPGAGYPKLEMYFRGITGDLLRYPNSPFNMTMKLIPAPDYDYRNGETYFMQVVPDRDVELFYRISAKAISGNQTVVSSPLIDLPKIDSKGPSFKDPAPQSGIWQRSNIVEFSVNITDDLSGVDPWSVFYQRYVPMTESWEMWQRRGSVQATEGGGAIYKVNVTLAEGSENKLRVRAKDNAGNGAPGSEYAVSPQYNVWVDVSGPFIEIKEPSLGSVLKSPMVHLKARLLDAGSGVDLTTVEVSYSASGLSSFGPWFNLTALDGKVTEEKGSEGVFYAEADLSLTYGYYNYIRVRAKDKLGNEGQSQNMQVMIVKTGGEVVDRPPSRVESIQPKVSGSVRPHITWTQSYDPDGDLVTYYLRIVDLSTGLAVVDWTHLTTGDTYFDPGSDVTMNPGKNYRIEIVPSARSLNGTQTNSTLQISTEANYPPEPVSEIWPKATGEARPVIRWNPAADPDGDQVYYFIRAGTYFGGSDIAGWTSLLKETKFAVQRDLGIGMVYVDIICSDGKDFSPMAHFTVSVGVYKPVIEVERATIVVYPNNWTMIDVKISNKGFTFDSIKIRIDGSATERPDMDIYLADDIIEISAHSSQNTTLRIETAKDAKVGIYTLNITAVSADGLSADTRAISVRIVDPKNLPQPPTESPGEDGDRDVEIMLWVFFILLLVVLSAMFYGYYRIDRKQREREVEVIPSRKGRVRAVPPAEPKEQVRSKEEEYEELYGEKVEGKPKLPPSKGKKKRKK